MRLPLAAVAVRFQSTWLRTLPKCSGAPLARLKDRVFAGVTALPRDLLATTATMRALLLAVPLRAARRMGGGAVLFKGTRPLRSRSAALQPERSRSPARARDRTAEVLGAASSAPPARRAQDLPPVTPGCTSQLVPVRGGRRGLVPQLPTGSHITMESKSGHEAIDSFR